MPTRNGSGTFSELSSSGLRQFGGRVYEEFLPALKGTKATRAYREMRDNDAIIGAIIFAIEMRIRQIEWWDEPADDSDEAKKAAEFATSCREDMSETWQDTISEVLSMLVYGWSFLELVYKRREGENPDDPSRHSSYDDGYISWRKLPLVPQDTLDHWEFSDDESLRGIHQRTDRGHFYVPIEKGLLFRTQVRKRNPEGRSILRNAWRSWYMKRRIENIEGVGIERDLAGLPMIKAPEDVPIFDSERPEMVALRNQAETIVRNVRRDEQEGVLLPHGWEFELMSTGGRRQFDTGQIIERYDRRMAMVALQDAILLGHEHVGSYALADAKTDMGALALIAWPDMITAIFNNYAYPRLFALNPFSPDVIPELKHGDLEQRDLAEFSDAVAKLVPLGLITPQEDDEAFVRDMFGMPPKPDLTPEEEAAQQLDEETRIQAAVAAELANQQGAVEGNGQVPGQVPGDNPLVKHLPGQHNQHTHGNRYGTDSKSNRHLTHHGGSGKGTKNGQSANSTGNGGDTPAKQDPLAGIDHVAAHSGIVLARGPGDTPTSDQFDALKQEYPKGKQLVWNNDKYIKLKGKAKTPKQSAGKPNSENSAGAKGDTTTPGQISPPKTKSPRKYRSFSGLEGENWGDEKFQPWRENLNPDESKALRDYAKTSHEPVNKALRQSGTPSPDTAKHIADLDSALDKSEVPDNVVVFRRLSDPKVSDLFKAGKLKGATIMDGGYTSTTADPDMLDELDLPRGDVPMNARIKVPKGTKGAYLDGLSGYPEEQELLLHRGTRFKVNKAALDSENILQLELEVA